MTMTPHHPRNDIPVSQPFWHWLIRALGMPALLATPAREAGRLPASRLDAPARQKLEAWDLTIADEARLAVSGDATLPHLLRRRLGQVTLAPDGVLYPRHEAEVQTLLTLCAQRDIAVVAAAGADGIAQPQSSHKALVALDLGGLDRVRSQDAVSGLMDVEAGIGGTALERQLDALGLTLGQSFDSSLGAWITSGKNLPEAVQAVRLATPQGTVTLESGFRHVLSAARGGLGIITSARLRVSPKPAGEDRCAYLFRDFAAGIAVLRQAVRAGVALGSVSLADDGATTFERAMQRRSWDIARRLFEAWLALRDFDGGAARLTVRFRGSPEQRRLARKDFEALANKAGVLRLGRTKPPHPYPRDQFLDQGLGIDHLESRVTWSALPLQYARARAALKQAMRAHAPVAGAHGLVLAHIRDIRSDGALLTVTWLFPRRLDDEVGQATAIRQSALAVLGDTASQGLERQMRDALKRTLDPTDILPV